jgi:hypothetical protein
MGNTWIIDITHLLADDGAIAPLPDPARRLAEFLEKLLVDASAQPLVGTTSQRSDVAADLDESLVLARSKLILTQTLKQSSGGVLCAVTTGLSAVGKGRCGTALPTR